MFYDKDNYLMNIPFLTSCNITEYDISKANINILLALGDISLEEYNKIMMMNRMERQIYVGKLQRDNEKINNDLKNGFKHYRKMFIESNEFTQADILSIKKDAIFVINKTANNCIFDKYVEFVPKNKYTSFFKIKNLEIYYLLDRINDIENIDVKGIDDNKLRSHANYMIQFLCIIFEALNSRSPEGVIELIVEFSKKYINRELELGYYREFNADSFFRISMNDTQYLLDFALEYEKPYLNLSYNYQIIQELYKIASTLYFSIKR